MLPYGRQWIDDADVQAVAAVLESDWLTTGPKVGEFEHAIAEFCGVTHGVAVCNGTAALHAAMVAAGVGPGDEVVVATMTFAASANAVLYVGGTPVFADVEEDTLLIDPKQVEARISTRTRAVVAVDYAGQPCNYDALEAICRPRGIRLIADASHSIGAQYRGRRVGSLAHLTTFSFHPVKHITTGEGGMIMTGDEGLAQAMRVFRNHGITSDHQQRSVAGSWFYEMVELGFNYRITDFQCALGLSQLQKLSGWVRRRQELAARYDAGFAGSKVEPLRTAPEVSNAHHLYVVRVNDRARVFQQLRALGIGVNVHYIPVHMHPYYQRRLGTGAGLCPVAEAAYERIISLPMFPRMTNDDADRVIEALHKTVS